MPDLGGLSLLKAQAGASLTALIDCRSVRALKPRCSQPSWRVFRALFRQKSAFEHIKKLSHLERSMSEIRCLPFFLNIEDA